VLKDVENVVAHNFIGFVPDQPQPKHQETQRL
jgi:hypothetical protein